MAVSTDEPMNRDQKEAVLNAFVQYLFDQNYDEARVTDLLATNEVIDEFLDEMED